MDYYYITRKLTNIVFGDDAIVAEEQDIFQMQWASRAP